MYNNASQLNSEMVQQKKVKEGKRKKTPMPMFSLGQHFTLIVNYIKATL